MAFDGSFKADGSLTVSLDHAKEIVA